MKIPLYNPFMVVYHNLLWCQFLRVECQTELVAQKLHGFKWHFHQPHFSMKYQKCYSFTAVKIRINVLSHFYANNAYFSHNFKYCTTKHNCFPTLQILYGLGSVVNIATAYRLDGPGIESRWGWDFPHPSRPALMPTQPPVRWVPVPGLSLG